MSVCFLAKKGQQILQVLDESSVAVAERLSFEYYENIFQMEAQTTHKICRVYAVFYAHS